ncbi:DUF4920 domain-containing protein [Mucilaginibacter aquatilis]|uniref:DUF4920 domain-containing protein n=1 Tax=Mucilaginibacter aquatilis TaxID=1517760 RepID=A0A6I4IAN8_9SPHI|nr:DUF4920 domain-containing protein [Mucilaginibacter aquatilis]MVN92231.1 DUF4920 domain-containing protein [Mucilaginibacter aquatilis]
MFTSVIKRTLITVSFSCLFTLNVNAQKKTALPHGMVFGAKPGSVGLMQASKLESFMGRRTRTSAVINGRVIKVTKPKGGWFELDADSGRVIKAHFKNYNVTLPTALKGREVIIEGVAAKQFIADDQQHMAGDTVKGKKQHETNTDPKRRIVFEVTGLMVNK